MLKEELKELIQTEEVQANPELSRELNEIYAKCSSRFFPMYESQYSWSVDGKEFAGHQELSKSLETLCFFAKPYHSWERGLNEHANGLLRQFIPKKSDFGQFSQEDIDFAQNSLNNRPRKILHYQTPAEMFLKHASVAFAA